MNQSRNDCKVNREDIHKEQPRAGRLKERKEKKIIKEMEEMTSSTAITVENFSLLNNLIP